MRLAATALAMIVSMTGCACDGGPWVELRGQRICVEIADDDAERARGLMFRDALGRGQGMLFVFPDEQPRSFWMMNTRIPLDILYFDSERRLVSASQRTPPCRSSQRCPSYPSDGPARYVLELDAGQASALGVQRGDELRFSPGLADAADDGTP